MGDGGCVDGGSSAIAWTQRRGRGVIYRYISACTSTSRVCGHGCAAVVAVAAAFAAVVAIDASVVVAVVVSVVGGSVGPHVGARVDNPRCIATHARSMISNAHIRV